MDWEALQELNADILAEYASGQTAVFGSVRASPTEGQVARGKAFERWGSDTTYRRTLYVVAGIFSTLPAVRSTCTYRGATWRIIDIDHNESAGIIAFHLADA